MTLKYQGQYKHNDQRTISTARSVTMVPTSLSALIFSYLASMVHFTTSPSRGTPAFTR